MGQLGTEKQPIKTTLHLTPEEALKLADRLAESARQCLRERPPTKALVEKIKQEYILDTGETDTPGLLALFSWKTNILELLIEAVPHLAAVFPGVKPILDISNYEELLFRVTVAWDGDDAEQRMTSFFANWWITAAHLSESCVTFDYFYLHQMEGLNV